MSDKTEKLALDSASVLKMQSITQSPKVGGSATIPPMQLAPSKSATPPQTTQNSSGSNSRNKNGK